MNRNPVGWFEIYVHDMSRAKAFYEAVFAVKLERLENPLTLDVPGLELWSFPMNPDRPGASGALVHRPGCPPGGSTLVYFSCADCATEASRIEAQGGRIVQSKTSIGIYGFIAIGLDLEGNLIGLHSLA